MTKEILERAKKFDEKMIHEKALSLSYSEMYLKMNDDFQTIARYQHAKDLETIEKLIKVIEVMGEALTKITFSRGSDMGSVNANNFNHARQASTIAAKILKEG